ncbi:hypothetical protein [Meiothermus sp. CFH 77666]|uniref:COG1470 family protein n=1 Tax=Meiothermus sp. CFH 77666 TaxID=2817942 RepID=UPI001AA07546|nr:hypothetical protein [Meiothermus sp. CFH 77666]MBO1438416.1 hypothetical protein [Meiothermus sp. CFH 77666]
MRYRLLSLLLIAGCAGGNPTPPPPPVVGDFQIALSNGTLNLEAGTTGSLEVTLEKTGGFSAEVQLSLVRVPSTLGVNASFSQNPIQSSSTLTLNPSSGLAPGEYTLLVRATANVSGQVLKRERTLNLGVSASSQISVSGQAKNRFGQPLANVPVCQGSRCVNTDAEGRFSLSGVRPPYDLTVRPAATQEHTFLGLSRPDPLLLLFTSQGGAPAEQTASLSGTLLPQSGSGITFPNPSNTGVQVVFGAPQARLTQFVPPGYNLQALFPGQGPAYTLSTAWNGTGSVQGRVYALQWRHAAGAPGTPEAFLAYGSRVVSLDPGESVSLNVGVAPISTGALSVNLTNPSGLTLRSRQLYVNLEARSLFLVASNNAESPLNLSWATPVIPGKTLTFAAYADAPDGRTLSFQQNGLGPNGLINLNLPVAPNPLSPGQNQSGLSLNTPLQWSRPATSICLLFLSSAGQPTRTFYTDRTTVVPGLEANRTYTWGLTCYGPFANIDAFATDSWPLGYPAFGWDTTFFSATTPARSFSTAP